MLYYCCARHMMCNNKSIHIVLFIRGLGSIRYHKISIFLVWQDSLLATATPPEPQPKSAMSLWFLVILFHDPGGSVARTTGVICCDEECRFTAEIDFCAFTNYRKTQEYDAL